MVSAPTSPSIAFSSLSLTTSSPNAPSGSASNSRNTPSSNPAHQFSAMPVEVKENIYEHAICMTRPLPHPTSMISAAWYHVRVQPLYHTSLKVRVETMSGSGPRCLDSRLPAIYFTSMTEYQIAVPVFIREAIFQISRLQHAELLALYMADLKRDGLTGGLAIRKVEVTYKGTSPVEEVGGMLKELTRYTGLEKVIIQIPLAELDFTVTEVGRLTFYTRDTGVSADDIIAKFQLETILKCVSLKRLVLVAIVPPYDTIDRMPAYYGHIGPRLWLAGPRSVARSLEAKKSGLEVAVDFIPIEMVTDVGCDIGWQADDWDDWEGRLARRRSI